MSDARIKIRANRSTGELEVEGPAQAVAEWWEKLWPELGQAGRTGTGPSSGAARAPLVPSRSNEEMPEVFGEFYTEFRSDITDVDKVLIAGAFAQERDQERVFTTTEAKQLLLDQSIKVANPSESVRRLKDTKRVFAVSDGKFRVSATGLDYLNSLRVNI